MKRKIATMQELKSCLKTSIKMTVLRKLRELSYTTSYSHSGKYYSLASIPKFDQNGLWAFNEVYFSKHGTLINTINEFINFSSMGYSRKELEAILHVKVQETLYELFESKIITREKVSGCYTYFSKNSDAYRRQRLLRQEHLESEDRLSGDEDIILVHELRAAIILFYSVLDEQQRRLYAGIESLKIGHGGDKKISELLGIDPHTVSKGRQELLNRDIDVERVRKGGGGRKSVEKKRRKS